VRDDLALSPADGGATPSKTSSGTFVREDSQRLLIFIIKNHAVMPLSLKPSDALKY